MGPVLALQTSLASELIAQTDIGKSCSFSVVLSRPGRPNSKLDILRDSRRCLCPEGPGAVFFRSSSEGALCPKPNLASGLKQLASLSVSSELFRRNILWTPLDALPDSSLGEITGSSAIAPGIDWMFGLRGSSSARWIQEDFISSDLRSCAWRSKRMLGLRGPLNSRSKTAGTWSSLILVIVVKHFCNVPSPDNAGEVCISDVAWVSRADSDSKAPRSSAFSVASSCIF
mmetsp:Transcript_6735/g.15871  ORF Transcript_6735/g.15871 Transcript_6735/m.15871 type:complete len:229 (-) Transcript_6735:1486-2172(-)